MIGIPLPPIDFFWQVVDVLAKRYGWSVSEIAENMYWEDVYDLYEFASNMNTLEKSEEMKFQVILHATSKDCINNWKDLPIPFPNRKWKPAPKKERLPKAFERHVKREKMSPAQEERYKYVQKRLEEHKKKVAEQRMDYYAGYYQN
jgi:hypothetical protein